MTQVKFHVEGGAGRSRDTDMREGFRKFFSELDKAIKSQGNSVRFVLHGSRREAYNQFCHALRNEPEAYHVLLVDSEDAVKHWGECWRHLKERQEDGWARPTGVEEAQCQLMVQATEAWFFADPMKLKEHYDPGLGSLPGRHNVEQIPKGDHISTLVAATRHTQKGQYHKTKHLPLLLGKIRAGEVRQRAWHCDRIFLTLSERLGARLTPLCIFQQEP